MLEDNLITESESVTTPILTEIPVQHVPNDTDHISASDDEDFQPKSKTSTPDSKQSATVVTKHPLTKAKSSLVSYHFSEGEEEEEEENENEMEEETQTTNVLLELMDVTPLKTEDVSPSTRELPQVLIFPEDSDIKIPPEPTKSCSAKLEKKFEEYYIRMKKTGVDHLDQNARIQELKAFRNPSMYEKIVAHLDIDEIGTNFPPEFYNLHLWGKESFYDELGKAQKLEMEKREKERRERTRIQYATGMRRVDLPDIRSGTEMGDKRKTRFD